MRSRLCAEARDQVSASGEARRSAYVRVNTLILVLIKLTEFQFEQKSMAGGRAASVMIEIVVHQADNFMLEAGMRLPAVSEICTV